MGGRAKPVMYHTYTDAAPVEKRQRQHGRERRPVITALARAIRIERKKRRLTQAELAEALGRKRTQVVNWETGHRGVTWEDANMLRKFFGVDWKFRRVWLPHHFESGADLIEDQSS